MMTLSQLEEEAKKRKERLQQWKIDKTTTTKRKELDGDEEQQAIVEFPKPIFRNYKPRDVNQLAGAIVLPRPELVDVKALVIISLLSSLFIDWNFPRLDR